MSDITTSEKTLPNPPSNQTIHRESSSQLSESTSTSSVARTLDTNNTELTSPSKSIRNFFKSRLSSYSIESISEEPEKTTLSPTKDDEQFLGTSNATISSPTGNKISNLLTKPIFSRSKSSNTSVPQTQNYQTNASSSFVQLNSSQGSLPKQKPVTIDDFADTESSSEGETNHTYDEESVNSLLLEYERPRTFVYTELDDEGQADTSPVKSEIKKDINTSQVSGDHSLTSQYGSPSIEKVDRAVRVTTPPVIRESPLRFNNRNEPLSAPARNSQGSDIFGNRLSDSDTDKYPEPNLSNMATPLNTPQIKHIIQNPRNSGGDDSIYGSSHRLAEIMDTEQEETALRNSSGSRLGDSARNSINTNETMLKRNTIRSSMSSGELLHKLQNFDDHERPQASSTLRFSQNTDDLDDLHNKNFGNLTAGIDSTNSLPFMLYKVQDKDYDESNQRWSVYESNRVSQMKEESSKQGEQIDTPIAPLAEPPAIQPPSVPDHEDLRQGSISSSASNLDRYEEANEYFNESQTSLQPPNAKFIGIIPTKSSSSSSQVYHTASGHDTTSSNLYHTVTEGTISSAASVSTFRQVLPVSGPEHEQVTPVQHHPVESPIPTHINSQVFEVDPTSQHTHSVSPPVLGQQIISTQAYNQSEKTSDHELNTPITTNPSIVPSGPVFPQPAPAARVITPMNQTHSEQDMYEVNPDSLVLSKPPPHLVIPNPTDYQGKGTVRHEDDYYLRDVERQIMNLNTQGQNSPYASKLRNHYSWSRFIAMMVIGLLAPPIYFLLAIGVFDADNNYQQYYSGMHYYNNHAVHSESKSSSTISNPNKFSKTQKTISLVVGVSWTIIILAMIGVGLGVGLTR
ncbi:uncharacterized protein RJT21DRAFT_596 [Scheffersomyces amazonensis]|uniref:uncharacterized protein n=1 Tax=Scheffersomyces amazonensis TaxID=1078765 RepID=UPI00315D4EEF